MTAGWQRALDKLDGTLDRYLGESIMVVPMRKGEFASAPDPERATFDITGLAAEWETSADAVTKLQSRTTVETMVVEVKAALLPAGARIVKGDELVLLDRPRAPRLVITRTERLDPGRVVWVCGPTAD